MAQQRKRNKPTLVCIRCKRRKIKCNRELPCSSCIRTNVPGECSYESKWVSFVNQNTKKIKQENDTIRLFDNLRYSDKDNKRSYETDDVNVQEGPKSFDEVKKRSIVDTSGQNYVVPPFNPFYANPTGPADEEANFHEGYTPIHVKDESRRLCFNPLCWASLLKKDPALNKICSFLQARPTPLALLMKSVPSLNEENIKEILAKNGKQSKSESEFVSKLLQVEGYEELLPYKKLLKIRPKINNTMVSTRTLTNTLFDGQIEPEMQLIGKINAIMPTKKTMWKLIDKYFETVYPDLPFIDKQYFQEDMEKIFGEKSYKNEPFDRIKILKRLDLANVALCLIILRLTYLSLFSNRKCMNEKIIHSTDASSSVQDLKFLFLNPINMSVIDIAKQCLDRFEISRKTNLIVFQATFYMRQYHSMAPEDGDGTDGGDSQVSTAVLIQMAYALGLNREPDKFKDVCNDEKLNNLGRKIWHYLVRSDIIHCFHVGNPKSIDSKYFDVNYPFCTENNNNCDSKEMEKAISHTFVWFHERCGCIKKIVDMLLDIRSCFKMNELTQTLNEVERIAREDFCTLEGMSINESDAERFLHIVKSKIFMAVKGSCITLYHHIYLYYEKKLTYDIMFFYLKKFYVILQKDLAPYFFAVFYGKLSDRGLVLNPYVEMALHKANQFNIAIYLRAKAKVNLMLKNKCHLDLMKDDKDYKARFLKYSSLSTNLKAIANLLISLMSNISDRYYYAWRVVKVQSYLLAVSSDPEFDGGVTEGAWESDSFNFNLLQLEDLDSETHAVGKELEAIVGYQDFPDISAETAFYDTSKKSRHNTKVDDEIPHYKNGRVASTEKLNDLENVFDLSSPSVANDDSPLHNFVNPENDEIDQMWLLVMALKYDPLELMSGDFDPFGYLNQPFQSTLGERIDTNYTANGEYSNSHQ